MAVSLLFEDKSVALTAFWQVFRQAVQARSDYTPNPSPADVTFPWEDVALETNWPRYGRQHEAFVRGTYDNDTYNRYLDVLLDCQQTLCIVNMSPYTLTQDYLVPNPHLISADCSLTVQDRAFNPRTISMPALPLVSGRFEPSRKKYLATFRGGANHPVRQAMTRLNQAPGFLCELTNRTGYVGTIDASNNIIDSSYRDLLDESIFALVPRGDQHFSYRLLESMSFGCIPIILSDDWILPFDRTIPWRDMSLHVPEAASDLIPGMLATLSPESIFALQTRVTEVYARHLGTIEVILDTLIGEARGIIAPTQATSA